WAVPRYSPKESMQPLRRARPLTARELGPRGGFTAALPGLTLEPPAWVRGRHDTGASCPSCNLAREAAALSLATRIGSCRCVDPAGETASLPFPSRLTPATFTPSPP